MPADKPFRTIEDAHALAHAIVDTVRELLLVLDGDLRVVGASRSFYRAFKVKPEEVEGKLLYTLGDGQWDIPSLRTLLEEIIPEQTTMEDFEVERDFPSLGLRFMCLNARKVFYENSPKTSILLAIEDITLRRAIEREKEALAEKTAELLQQKDVLLQEMQHRVANSLQIIASILMLKARKVTSEETRLHLHDAHSRVMSVAAVQKYLQPTGHGNLIEIAPYLVKLCESLAGSMIGDRRKILLTVRAGRGEAVSASAVSLGLIVTELVMNALKYAFPDDRASGEVIVSYDVDGDNWKLAVSDNGIGRAAAAGLPKSTGGGLGTSLVKALSQQLGAEVRIVSSDKGMSTTIARSALAVAA